MSSYPTSMMVESLDHSPSKKRNSPSKTSTTTATKSSSPMKQKKKLLPISPSSGKEIDTKGIQLIHPLLATAEGVVLREAESLVTATKTTTISLNGTETSSSVFAQPKPKQSRMTFVSITRDNTDGKYYLYIYQNYYIWNIIIWKSFIFLLFFLLTLFTLLTLLFYTLII